MCFYQSCFVVVTTDEKGISKVPNFVIQVCAGIKVSKMTTVTNCLEVTLVKPSSLAAKLGLKVGDVLIRLGEQKLSSSFEFSKALTANKGDSTLVFFRDGSELQLVLPSGVLGIEVVAVPFDPSTIERDQERRRLKANIILTTTPTVEGYQVLQHHGIVTSECVFGLNIFKDFFMGLTDFLGGRSSTAQSALKDARENCLRELSIEAVDKGANAVIGISLDYSEFSGGGKSMLFLVATGTAVTLTKV